MRLFGIAGDVPKLLVCIAFLCSLTASAGAAAMTAGGALLQGLDHESESGVRGRVKWEIHRWRSPQRYFVLRFAQITEEDVSWDGKREMDARELGVIARALAAVTVQAAESEVSMDGAYGNFRVALFKSDTGMKCFGLRSYSGNNWPDTYSTFEGGGEPMGPDLLQGLFCREAGEISMDEVQGLLDTIQ